MVMILQRQRQFFWLRFIRRAFAVSRRAAQFHIVLHQCAIVKNGFASGAEQLASLIKTRPVKDDIVSLPLAGRARRVHQWWILTVDSGCLAISISFVFVGIEYLNFVEAHQKDAAVAA